jgi:PAS domain S-box-containing protein
MSQPPDNLNAPPVDMYQTSRIIAETAADAIITIDAQSTILFVNRAAERIFGYSTTEMLGQPLTMLMPEYLRHVHRAALERYVNTGQRHLSWDVVALPGLHRDGREIPLELSFGEFEENGRRLFTGIARDMSERRQLERLLRAQLEVGRVLAESESLSRAAPALLKGICESLGWETGQMWYLDREAQVLRWAAAWHGASIDSSQFEDASRNRTFVRGVGLPGRIWDSAVAESIPDVGSDPDFSRGEFAARAGLRSALGFPILVGQEVCGVFELLTREKREPDRSLLDMMNSIGHQVGQFVERRRAEEERAQIFDREQRARHEVEVTMDRMRQVQTVTDIALAHLSLDELLEDLLSRVKEAMQVDTVAILLMSADGQELVAWAAKGFEEEVEHGVRIPLGAGFSGKVATNKSPVIINDLESADVLNPLLREKGIKSLLGVPLLVEGRVLGVIHVGKFVAYQFSVDDTRLLQVVADRIALAIDNARLFEEERAARREAEAASRAKDEFLTTISHELRTPLTPIIGWVHMIRNGVLPEKETLHGLTVIEKNSHALKRLINDLLDMSAILSGKMRMEALPVALEGTIREAMETVRTLAAEFEIHLDLTFRNWQNEVVMGDRARLVQVFSNLLNNAIKFSAPGSRVEIVCEVNNGDAVINIQDAGKGISTEFLPFVFERFRQEDGSKTRSHGGLGLGLALVKNFVEAHKGSVKAESGGAGLGSRFSVRLPLREVGVKSPAGVAKDDGKQEPPPPHLLVVEDDSDTLEMLRATLEARGYRVTANETAAEALKLALGNSFDLIISDIGMPEIDGFEMMRQMREVPGYKKVPAIALSGYASQKDAKAALASGFNAHVSKPVDPDELISMVKGLLDKSSSKK